jgi:hypothetical protein
MQSESRWTGSAFALVVIGLLILIPSGLCTGVFGVGALLDLGSGQGYEVVMLVGALVIGGPFIILGTLLLRTGLRERRRT